MADLPELGDDDLVADVGVDVWARCRDCGEHIDPETLVGRATHVSDDDEQTDRGGSLVYMTVPGGCTRCGGGRIEAAVDFGI